MIYEEPLATTDVFEMASGSGDRIVRSLAQEVQRSRTAEALQGARVEALRAIGEAAEAAERRLAHDARVAKAREALKTGVKLVLRWELVGPGTEETLRYRESNPIESHTCEIAMETHNDASWPIHAVAGVLYAAMDWASDLARREAAR